MSYSSILGADTAPLLPSGRSSELLGPSDNSDSGSDARGTEEVHGDSDSTGTGERGEAIGADIPEGRDILPDRIIRVDDGASVERLRGEEEFIDLDENEHPQAPSEDEDSSA